MARTSCCYAEVCKQATKITCHESAAAGLDSGEIVCILEYNNTDPVQAHVLSYLEGREYKHHCRLLHSIVSDFYIVYSLDFFALLYFIFQIEML